MSQRRKLVEEVSQKWEMECLRDKTQTTCPPDPLLGTFNLGNVLHYHSICFIFTEFLKTTSCQYPDKWSIHAAVLSHVSQFHDSHRGQVTLRGDGMVSRVTP